MVKFFKNIVRLFNRKLYHLYNEQGVHVGMYLDYEDEMCIDHYIHSSDKFKKIMLLAHIEPDIFTFKYNFPTHLHFTTAPSVITFNKMYTIDMFLNSFDIKMELSK